MTAFEASLPLMVATPPSFLGMEPAAFRDLEHELANSAQVRRQLRNSTAKEFAIYDKARSMYAAKRDAYPGGEAASNPDPNPNPNPLTLALTETKPKP